MEPTLTPLGLTHAELASALGSYRSRLGALMRAVGEPAPMSLHSNAYPALEDLDAMIDVDLGARAASSGQARMTEVERTVLVPLLSRLHARLAQLAHGMPPKTWIPVLRDADEDVAASERALARRGVLPRARPAPLPGQTPVGRCSARHSSR